MVGKIDTLRFLQFPKFPKASVIHSFRSEQFCDSQAFSKQVRNPGLTPHTITTPQPPLSALQRLVFGTYDEQAYTHLTHIPQARPGGRTREIPVCREDEGVLQVHSTSTALRDPRPQENCFFDLSSGAPHSIKPLIVRHCGCRILALGGILTLGGGGVVGRSGQLTRDLGAVLGYALICKT